MNEKNFKYYNIFMSSMPRALTELRYIAWKIRKTNTR